MKILETGVRRGRKRVKEGGESRKKRGRWSPGIRELGRRKDNRNGGEKTQKREKRKRR